MYTRCSHCNTPCEVSPEALAQGRGQLQCMQCGRDFDALESLTSDAPGQLAPPPEMRPQGLLDLAQPEAAEPTPPRTDALVDVLAAHADFIEPLESEATHHFPALSEAWAESDSGTALTIDTGIAPQIDRAAQPEASDAPDDLSAWPSQDAEPHTSSMPAEDRTDDLAPQAGPADDAKASGATSTHPEQPADLARDVVDPFHPVLSAPAPSFIPDTAPTLPIDAPAQRRWPRWLAVAALLVLLIGQSIHAESEYLAADARWRPWLERACNTLGCTLPAWHDPGAMRLMTRDVRPHPSVSGALLISASFRNDAPWPQQWPHLHLSLSDLNGQTIAQREFAPDQYLGMTARDLAIQPGQTASVALEVRDPGKQAVAFEFDFR